MKVLITGGAGYIGSHINLYFATKGADTVVLDNLSEGHIEAVTYGRFVKGSAGDKPLLDKLLREEKFDAIIHCAGFSTVSDSIARPSRYYSNNVAEMRTLLDASVENGIRAFVFTSSAEVYGDTESPAVNEAHKLEPINPYGFTKLIGEKMLADYERAYGLKWCALRCFNVAGSEPNATLGEAHEPETHLVPRLLRCARTQSYMKICGADYPTRDGTCLRDYVHVLDVAAAHWQGAMRLLRSGASATFNIGSGEGYTVLEMLAACQNATGVKIPHKLEGRRAGDAATLVAANQKARNELGWKPVYSDIDAIISSAWDWEQTRSF